MAAMKAGRLLVRLRDAQQLGLLVQAARKVSDTGVPSSRKPWGRITAGWPVKLVATSWVRFAAFVGVTITSTVCISRCHCCIATVRARFAFT
jgi:hypothetical protein